jgi:hypothetical protein
MKVIKKRFLMQMNSELLVKADKKTAMKQYFFLITILITTNTCAQHLFDLDDSQSEWVIVYIDGKTKVNVKVSDPRPLKNKLNDQVMDYYFYKGKVVTDYIDEEGDVFSTKEYPSCSFPYYIKIRNNSFQYGSRSNDSIVIDRKGRVCKVYSELIKQGGFIPSPGQQSETHIRYLSDTSMLKFGIYQGRLIPEFQVIILDTLANLRMVYWSEPDSSLCDSIYKGVKSISDIKDWAGIRFNYDKSVNWIKSIQKFISKSGKEISLLTQYFTYQNGRPASSYAIDEKTKEKVMIQKYVYKPYKEK